MKNKVLYIRCNSGHYFSGGENCPLDNWSLPRYEELEEVIVQMETEGIDISIEEFRKRGVSDDILARIIIIDFGSVNSVFTGLVPEGYIGREGNFIPVNLASSDYH
ncbi:MAG: hypothetical protein JXJ17_13700 [Anaerolineae bacterium]|nr:hypothetical protein [Anaerolineae bacterium]